MLYAMSTLEICSIYPLSKRQASKQPRKQTKKTTGENFVRIIGLKCFVLISEKDRKIQEV